MSFKDGTASPSSAARLRAVLASTQRLMSTRRASGDALTLPSPPMAGAAGVTAGPSAAPVAGLVGEEEGEASGRTSAAGMRGLREAADPGTEEGLSGAPSPSSVLGF